MSTLPDIGLYGVPEAEGSGRALFDAFKASAQRHSDDVAMVDARGRWTYAQALHQVLAMSAMLARTNAGLAGQSLQPGRVRSALMVSAGKSAASVMWQLASSHASHVFVPCDPNTPSQRLRHIASRTAPQWWVDDESRDHGDDGFSRVGPVPGGVLWVAQAHKQYPNSVSHIIFSSGSTGQPKAIWLPAEPLVEVVREQARRVGLAPKQQFAWLLSPSFDASLSDIYSTLLSGATLHVCEFSQRQRHTMLEYFSANGITHSDLSPSVLPLFKPQQLPSLKAIIFGGELAKEDVVAQWADAGCRLFNAYGPTEATICTHMRQVDTSWQSTNFGRPLPGVFCWLASSPVDVASQPKGSGETARCADETLVLNAPSPGQSGELVLAGSHIALGYDDPSLNARRFFSHQGQRCFRTGDVVRIDEAGDFHFIGRSDRQLKVHGVLVCPEEVEAAARHAGCNEAVVRLEGLRLVLHYSDMEGVRVDEVALREALAQQLPAAAVPHRFVRHEELQKSLAGKVML